MKNYYLLAMLLLCVLSVDAQEIQRSVSPLKPALSVITAPYELEAAQDTLPGATIEHLETYIQAIDTKVEYVNADQNLREKALADGWFDKMSVYRARAVARKEVLLNR